MDYWYEHLGHTDVEVTLPGIDLLMMGLSKVHEPFYQLVPSGGNSLAKGYICTDM